MTDKEYITMMQGDRLSREFPGTLATSGEGLAGKLAVAAVLGVLLAAVGGFTDHRPEQEAPQQAELPWTAQPPQIMVQE